MLVDVSLSTVIPCCITANKQSFKVSSFCSYSNAAPPLRDRQTAAVGPGGNRPLVVPTGLSKGPQTVRPHTTQFNITKPSAIRRLFSAEMLQ